MYKPCKYQVKDVFISSLSWEVKLNTVSEIFITNPHQEHRMSQYSKVNRRSVTELHKYWFTTVKLEAGRL